MPQEKNQTVYCTAPARDGKGGKYKIGDSIECEKKEEANKLLATGRFSANKEDVEAALKKAKADAAEKAKADAAEKALKEKDDEIAKLKKQLADASSKK